MADGNVRTADELKRQEFNYFEAFKINLDETDGDAIARQINTLSNQMVRLSDPVKVRLGKDLKADALEVMQFDAIYDQTNGRYRRGAGGRKIEAEACRRMRTEKVSAFIRTLGNRGIIYLSELQQIAEKNNVEMKYLAVQLDALKKGGLNIIDDTKNIYDFKSYIYIYNNLKSHEDGAFRDLFALIGIDKDGTAAEAKAKFDAEDAATFQKRQQKQHLALKNIYGTAKIIFDGSEEKFTAYKKFVLFCDDVFMPLKALSDNGFNTIGRDEYVNYIGILRKNLSEGDREAAQDLAYIMQYLRIKLSGDAVLDKNIKVELCPYPDCGKAYVGDSSAIVCPHCGRPLEKLCWNCNNKVRLKQGYTVCRRCGATERAQAEFTRQTAAFDLLISGGKATAAQMRQALNKIMAIVPGYAKEPDSEVAKKVAFYSSTVEGRESAEQGLLSKFANGIAEVDGQIALKNYYKAQSLLYVLHSSIPGFNEAQVEDYNKKISAEIAKSESYLQQAKQALTGGSNSTAIANAAKALDICADNAEAKQLMRKVPLAAPTAVRCKIISDKIIGVEFDCRPQQLTTYSIIRKVGAAPQNATDGMVIARGLKGNFYEDKNITTGTPYYYGVFAERSEVTSSVTTSGNSCAVFPDVYNCTQEMVEGAIKVKWTCPDNVTGITVRKVKGVAAMSAASGKAIATDGVGGFTDTDCDNTGCSYFVVCNYETGGAKVASKGIQLYYKPYLIPKAAQHLSVQRDGGGLFTISGGNLTADTRLYLFPARPAITAETAERKDGLNTAMAAAKPVNMAASGGEFVFSLGKGSAGWLCAVNSNDQLYVASSPVYVTTVSGLSDISYSVDGGMLTVKFTRIAAVKSITAKVGKSAFPSSIDDEGETFEFNGSAIYGGKLSFALPADSMAYVTLFAYAGEGAERTLCVPVNLSAAIDNRKKQVVKYSIKYTPSQAKPFTVTVKFEADGGADLSQLVFVAGNPWPMNKHAGTEVYRCPSPVLKKGVFTGGKYVAKLAFSAPPMSKYDEIEMFIDDDSVKTIILKRVKL